MISTRKVVILQIDSIFYISVAIESWSQKWHDFILVFTQMSLAMLHVEQLLSV